MWARCWARRGRGRVVNRMSCGDNGFYLTCVRLEIFVVRGPEVCNKGKLSFSLST